MTKSLLVVFFIAVATLVVGASYFIYTQTQELSKAIEDFSKDERYDFLKELRTVSAELDTMENLVWNFVNSGEEVYLDELNLRSDSLTERIRDRKENDLKRSREVRNNLGDLERLVRERYKVLYELAQSPQPEVGYLILDSLALSIEQQVAKASEKKYLLKTRYKNASSQKPRRKNAPSSESASTSVSHDTATIQDDAELSPAEKRQSRRNERKARKSKEKKGGGLFSFLKRKEEKPELTEAETSAPVEDTLAFEEEEDEMTGLTYSFPPSLAKQNQQLAEARMGELMKIRDQARVISDSVGQTLWDQMDRVLQLSNEDQRLTGEVLTLIQNIEYKEISASEKDELEAVKSATEKTKNIRLVGILVLGVCVIMLGIIFRNLDRRRKLEEQVKKERDRAEQLAQVKQQFLANMSHELRTPMNAIIGFTEQLAHTPMNTRQQDYLRPIRHAADYLLSLLNDILDYSKIEAGKILLEEVAFSPQELIQEVEETFQQRATEKGINLEARIRGNLPDAFTGDPVRIKQMLFNLVSNAIKFTDQGGVLMEVEWREKDPNKGLTLKVEDTGVGIPQDKLESIFEDFTQADSSTTRRYGGTGLGLSITKSLVKLYDGNLRVKSREGQGTQVSIRLPLQLADAGDIPQEQAEHATALPVNLLHGYTFLVVDDEPFNRLLSQTILHKYQAEVFTANDGKEALEVLRREDISLVLMDLSMPVMDGFTATRHIREDLKSEVPIIALTATFTPEESREALTIGMNDLLLKPFKERMLMDKITDRLPAVTVLDSPPQQAEVDGIYAHFTDHSDKPYDLAEMFELANRDKGFMQNMIGLFFKTADTNLQVMEEALADKNWQEFGLRAHRLAPPCRHLGLSSLVDQLKSLELNAKEGQHLDTIPQRFETLKRDLTQIIQDIKTDMEYL
ncbi:MAG: ATP-binding protein [Bacteroidota bacterium]